jgi:hypothetical protein
MATQRGGAAGGGQRVGVFGVACLAAARQLGCMNFFGWTIPCRIHECVQLVQIDFQSANLLVLMDFLLGEFYQINFVRSDSKGFGSDRWTPIDPGIRKLFHSIPNRRSIFSESMPSTLGQSQGKKMRSPRAPGDGGRLSSSDRSPAPDRARHPRPWCSHPGLACFGPDWYMQKRKEFGTKL